MIVIKLEHKLNQTLIRCWIINEFKRKVIPIFPGIIAPFLCTDFRNTSSLHVAIETDHLILNLVIMQIVQASEFGFEIVKSNDEIIQRAVWTFC